MRIVFVGASRAVVSAVRSLLDEGHDVVVIEDDEERIEGLQEDLDCAFLHGDGSKPEMLRDAYEDEHSVLLCVTSNNQTNILASAVGRSIGYGRVITAIDDPDLEVVCKELGLENLVLPAQAVGRTFHDLALDLGHAHLSSILRAGARITTLEIHEDGGLDLPDEARLVCAYRDNDIVFDVEPEGLRDRDVAVVFGRAAAIEKLEKRHNGQTD